MPDQGFDLPDQDFNDLYAENGPDMSGLAYDDAGNIITDDVDPLDDATGVCVGAPGQGESDDFEPAHTVYLDKWPLTYEMEYDSLIGCFTHLRYPCRIHHLPYPQSLENASY